MFDHTKNNPDDFCSDIDYTTDEINAECSRACDVCAKLAELIQDNETVRKRNRKQFDALAGEVKDAFEEIKRLADVVLGYLNED